MDSPPGKREANHEELMTLMKASQEGMGAHQEKLGIMDLEVNPEEVEVIAENQEVPNEEVAVETIRALEDQYGDQHLALGHCQQLKKRTQGNGGFQQKLAAAQGQLTHHAIPASHKEHGHKGDHKGWMLERRQQLNKSNYQSKPRL
jgi:hypothetical protein